MKHVTVARCLLLFVQPKLTGDMMPFRKVLILRPLSHGDLKILVGFFRKKRDPHGRFHHPLCRQAKKKVTLYTFILCETPALPGMPVTVTRITRCFLVKGSCDPGINLHSVASWGFTSQQPFGWFNENQRQAIL